jgi:hypothetical protein
MGWASAYQGADMTQEILELLWKNLAFATRYGKCDLMTAMELPGDWLGGYLHAVDTLLKEEQEAMKANT